MTHDSMDAIRDSLNRMAKLDLDNGTAPDIETAVARLHGHRIDVVVGPDLAFSPPHQAALLTVVNIARRFALGGVTVVGNLDVPSLVMGDGNTILSHEVEAQGGRIGDADPESVCIVIGDITTSHIRGTAVTFEGWRGGVVPLDGRRLTERTKTMPAAVLAGALAAAEAFAMLRGEVEGGRRAIGFSLWRPDRDCDWLCSDIDGPDPVALPDHLWVLGLGHLGQAFLWALMLCPYADRSGVRLILQDTDVVTPSTDSTSLLTQPAMVGSLKTRAVAEVLERHGFRTSLVERPFDDGFRRRASDDPAVLICGVDNALARSQLEAPGFPMVVEAGIGDRAQDFRALRLHTFPSGRTAADLWVPGRPRERASLVQPGYVRLSETGGDICGLTRLAETAVGAPFVGTVAGCLMLSQVMRLLCGDAVDATVDLDLRSMRSRRAIRNKVLGAFNPGFQAA
ncbi:hypothetical protein [Methylobacterium sp. GC_Met_2]|uniref:hypothetical protein n=1 Tax=Methylobacterium sp. GC_Met_2 TaxID=2937376 RepID=UPI00226B98CF|nr:hypothetical protein [Methylobacterium sp. GC_Met_2]